VPLPAPQVGQHRLHGLLHIHPEFHHVQEKLQFYNVARGSNAEVRSLTYVMEDNYPGLSAEARQLRERSAQAGKLISGLIRSTESRKTKLTGLLVSFLHVLLPF